MAGSVAIVGAGQIGFAAAYEFFAAGWDVRIYARSRPTWFQFERELREYVIGEHPAPQADVVLDTIAFDAEDIARYDPDKVGRLITISSASVYCDDEGRTLDEAAQNGFPEFNGPINEEQATVAPGPETYSTRKVRMENKAIELFGDRATILRPCAIYGKWSRHPREWWFVKRMLDGRTKIPLIHEGCSQFQTTDVEQIAWVACETAARDVGGAFNVTDTDTPSVLEIGQAISQYAQHDFEFVTHNLESFVGRTPWSVPKPFVVSGSKAAKVTGNSLIDFPYQDHVHPAVSWLMRFNPTDWRKAFPQLAAYPWDMFDYAAEDAFFETL